MLFLRRKKNVSIFLFKPEARVVKLSHIDTSQPIELHNSLDNVMEFFELIKISSFIQKKKFYRVTIDHRQNRLTHQ